MDSITITPLSLALIFIIGLALVLYVWRESKPKIEAQGIDAFHTMAAEGIAGMHKIVALERLDVARRAANLQVLQAQADAATAALGALMTAPSA